MCSLYNIHIRSTFERFLTSHQLTAAQHKYAHIRHSERIHMFNQWGEVLAGALSEGLNGHMTNCRHPVASDVNVSVFLWLKGLYRECERKEDGSLKNCGRESINNQTAKGLWRSSRKQITERAFSSSFAGGKTLRRDCFSPLAERQKVSQGAPPQTVFIHFLLHNVPGTSDRSHQGSGIQQFFRLQLDCLKYGIEESD